MLLVASAVLWFWPAAWKEHQVWIAACTRVGLMMAALWLAIPDMERLSPWIFGVALALVVVVAVRPRLLPFAIVAVVVLAFLRPRIRNA